MYIYTYMYIYTIVCLITNSLLDTCYLNFALESKLRSRILRETYMSYCLVPRGGDILGFNMENGILELNDSQN